MAKWTYPTVNTGLGGRFQILIHHAGHSPQDVTFFRNVPASLDSYSNADPFGDATAQITFPQITAFDDPYAIDMYQWFGVFANVDIWWCPAMDLTTNPNLDTSDLTPYIDPRTNRYGAYAPGGEYGTKVPGGDLLHDNRIKIFEGYVASIEYQLDDQGHSVQFQCQGALFQLDRYLMKPYYPNRPQPVEKVIRDAISPVRLPNLRTAPMKISWPDGWSTVFPQRHKNENIELVIDGKAGANWTGYATRDTGSWNKILTEYIQNALTGMVVKPNAEINHVGDQWTLLQELETSGGDKPETANTIGRRPVLQVRLTKRPADFTIWLGTPGVTGSFSRDSTQMANIVYADGQSLDGVTWNGAIISYDGARTEWKPLAWIPDIWPYTKNKTYSKKPFVSEAYVKFSGLNQAQATVAADTMLRRDMDPGYTGDLTLSSDPDDGFSRWTIRAGMTVKIKGFAGSADDGVNFHITQVMANPQDGTVELTLDTRYRDLLTVQEARARARDPLTPTILMQGNKYSVTIQDLQFPWSYKRGSGFLPRPSQKFWDSIPNGDLFPYRDHFKAKPPTSKKDQAWPSNITRHSDWYVRCNANAGYDEKSQTYSSHSKATKARWAFAPVITAERGTIRRTEAYVLDKHGNIIPCPFHMSLYYAKETPTAMPHNGKDGYSAFANNAWTTVDPQTGQPWPPGDSVHGPDKQIVDGALWGAKTNGIADFAGFYPGSQASGAKPSGILVDNTPWSFDNVTGNQNYPKEDAKKVGWKYKDTDIITLWAAFYAEWPTPVYFMARFWRQEPGTEDS